MAEIVDLAMDSSQEAMVRRVSHEALKVRERAADLSMQIEADIKYPGPIQYLLATAFSEAVNSLTKMAHADVTDTQEMRRLQNDVHRYLEITEWLATAVRSGREIFDDMPDDVKEQWLRNVVGNGDEF